MNRGTGRDLGDPSWDCQAPRGGRIQRLSFLGAVAAPCPLALLRGTNGPKALPAQQCWMWARQDPLQKPRETQGGPTWRRGRKSALAEEQPEGLRGRRGQLVVPSALLNNPFS